MILDWSRLLRNLEQWRIVNVDGRPPLCADEMYPLMQCFGEHYSGVLSMLQFTKVVQKFQSIYHKNISDMKREDETVRRDKAKAAKAGSTEAFVRTHWSGRPPCIPRKEKPRAPDIITAVQTKGDESN